MIVHACSSAADQLKVLKVLLYNSLSFLTYQNKCFQNVSQLIQRKTDLGMGRWGLLLGFLGRLFKTKLEHT